MTICLIHVHVCVTVLSTVHVHVHIRVTVLHVHVPSCFKAYVCSFLIRSICCFFANCSGDRDRPIPSHTIIFYNYTNTSLLTSNGCGSGRGITLLIFRALTTFLTDWTLQQQQQQ